FYQHEITPDLWLQARKRRLSFLRRLDEPSGERFRELLNLWGWPPSQRRGLPFALANHPMFQANILPGMRIVPAGDIACGVNAGDACFEKFVHQHALIERKARL